VVVDEKACIYRTGDTPDRSMRSSLARLPLDERIGQG
jgi:hypothetical protein